MELTKPFDRKSVGLRMSNEEFCEKIFREIVQCGGEIIGKTMRSSPQDKIEKTLAFHKVGLNLQSITI